MTNARKVAEACCYTDGVRGDGAPRSRSAKGETGLRRVHSKAPASCDSGNLGAKAGLRRGHDKKGEIGGVSGGSPTAGAGLARARRGTGRSGVALEQLGSMGATW